MFLDPSDGHGLKGLRRGQFALPNPARLPGLPPLADDDRLRRSIGGMQAVLRRNGFGGIADELGDPGDGRLSVRMGDLVDRILQAMREYLDGPASTDRIAGVFHRIQLWGGKTGRYIYVKAGGFAENFDGKAYDTLARAAASGRAAVDKVAEIRRASDGIGQLGVSFATKHANFWSWAAGAPCLPIYDRLIARGCFGHTGSDWRHYGRYVAEMTLHAKNAGIEVATLERIAFNFFSSEAGDRWIATRLNQGKKQKA